MIASEGKRVEAFFSRIAASYTTEIELLVFLGNLQEVVIDTHFEVKVGLMVCYLIEISVFNAVDGKDTFVVNLGTRLRIYLGSTHLGVGTESGSEHRELRVVRVLAADIPAQARQGGFIKEAKRLDAVVLIQDGDISKWRVVDDDDSIAGFICYSSFVGIGTHIAGTVAATIDIMVALEGTRAHGAFGKFKELLGILIVHDAVDGSLRLFVGNLIYRLGIQDGCSYLLEFLDVITDLLAVCQSGKPGGDVALDICLAVPYPGTAVYLYLGVTQNVGIGSLVGSILLAEHGLACFLLLFRFGFCTI